jgi:hypothetical protein
MDYILFVAIGEALVGDMISGILLPVCTSHHGLSIFLLSTNSVKAHVNVKKKVINSRRYDFSKRHTLMGIVIYSARPVSGSRIQGRNRMI